jgi:acetylornithine/succinyldiaminopimelate/putrescine aminotransferase
VFFTNSGTEAVEGAIKFCRAATGRQRILYQPSAFHGLSTGSLALNGDESFREGFGSLLPGATKVDFNNLEQVEAELLTESVAAVVMEPIRGKGVLFPNSETLYQQIQTLCRKTGTLLVCDEVQSGLGRTGKWWAFEHWALEPDIITCAKALSGGLIPVGAILYTNDIYKKVFSRLDRCVVHSSTFGQNALAMVAGLASLQVIEEEGLITNAKKCGDLLLEGLKRLQEKHQFIYDVRGKGLMIGIEFGSPKSLLLKPAWSLLHAAENGLFAQAVVMQMFKNHKILTQVSGHHQEIIKLIPPLNMTEEEVHMIINAFDAVMTECSSFPGPVWSVGKQLAGAAAKQHLLKRAKQPA